MCDKLLLGFKILQVEVEIRAISWSGSSGFLSKSGFQCLSEAMVSDE